MGFPESAARKLRNSLGVEGENLVTWLEEEHVERSLLGEEMTRMRGDMAATEMRLGERISNVKADLMKWSFVFWVGAIAAIAILAGVLDG